MVILKQVERTLDFIVGVFLVRILKLYCQFVDKPNMSQIHSGLFIGGGNDMSVLAEADVNVLVDLREEHEDEQVFADANAIEYLKVAIRNGEAPTFEQLQETTSWIESRLRDEKRVLIQCCLGRGRSPTIGCGYLIQSGMSLPVALAVVKKARRVTFINNKQLGALRRWEDVTVH